jgi:hypothetical protein
MPSAGGLVALMVLPVGSCRVMNLRSVNSSLWLHFCRRCGPFPVCSIVAQQHTHLPGQEAEREAATSVYKQPVSTAHINMYSVSRGDDDLPKKINERHQMYREQEAQ